MTFEFVLVLENAKHRALPFFYWNEITISIEFAVLMNYLKTISIHGHSDLMLILRWYLKVITCGRHVMLCLASSPRLHGNTIHPSWDRSGWEMAHLSSFHLVASTRNFLLHQVHLNICTLWFGLGVKCGLSIGGAPRMHNIPGLTQARHYNTFDPPNQCGGNRVNLTFSANHMWTT